MALQLTVTEKPTIQNFKVLLDTLNIVCAGGNYAEKMTEL
jgi:hypothetical protein